MSDQPDMDYTDIEFHEAQQERKSREAASPDRREGHIPPVASAQGSPFPLEHRRSCRALVGGPCDCGLDWRIRLATEQEMAAAWRKRAEEVEIGNAQQAEEIARLTKQLAECYRLTGADTDGNNDGALAPHAVEEVRRLRDDSEEEIARLRAEIAWRKGETAKLRLDLADRESQVQALRQALEKIARETVKARYLGKALKDIRQIAFDALAPGEAAPKETQG